jgi:hypothetical protein
VGSLNVVYQNGAGKREDLMEQDVSRICEPEALFLTI